MKILLAPMHGITDYYVRSQLSQIGGYDQCFTEFLRVTNSIFPARVFYKNCPEIAPEYNLQGKTISGTPVAIQLLGNHGDFMAANATKAVELGVKAIDINFGCPAKTVNGHGGGAILLKSPEKIYAILSNIRKAIPGTSLSAKIRLGYDDNSLLEENIDAIQSAGVDSMVIHARTKQDAYLPIRKWHEVPFDKIHIPVAINGEIWSTEDYRDCQNISKTKDIMLGRGAFVTPDLALQIKSLEQNSTHTLYNWHNLQPLLLSFMQQMLNDQLLSERIIAGRLKLWIKWLSGSYEECIELFNAIKSQRQLSPIANAIEQQKPLIPS